VFYSNKSVGANDHQHGAHAHQQDFNSGKVHLSS
jgi:hypothetical protein